MANIQTMQHNTAYRVTKGNTDGGIVAGDIVSYDSKCLVMWDGKGTGMYDSKDLSDPRIADFECEVAKDYQLVKNQGRISCRKITGNRMAEVAALFGKKLGEEFKMKLFTGRVWIAKFTSKGIKHCHNDSEWLRANDYLNDLLTGEAEIVED